MKRTHLMTPVAIGAALVLGLAGCGDDTGEGTVVVEETAVSTETETAVVEEDVTVAPTATVTETDDVEVETEVTETETDVEFDPEATQDLEDVDVEP